MLWLECIYLKKGMIGVMKRLVTMLSVVALCIASLSTIASANSKYTWPVPDSTRITQGFKGNTHKGIDIGAKTAGVAGNRIVAYYDGTVSRSGWSDSYGWVVYVHHVINSANYQSRYAHMNKTPAVSTNQKVGKGATLGYMGKTGDATGVHLHFETRKCTGACKTDNSSNPVNPITNFFPEHAGKVPKSIEPGETDPEKIDDVLDDIFYSVEEILNMTADERLSKGIPLD
ncbi:M23 family metallopeptidase [Paenibacillus thiaminolyticus]|nr:M23 family metallopeptidase [Paenibacillus thiaminolyticus]